MIFMKILSLIVALTTSGVSLYFGNVPAFLGWLIAGVWIVVSIVSGS